MARARRSAHRRDVGDARRPVGRALSRRCASCAACQAPSIRSRSSTPKGSRSAKRFAMCCREPADRCSAFCQAPARSNGPEPISSIACRRMSTSFRLHGSLDSDAQDAAIRAVDRRRIILATNIAETSLTVPGVSAVIDTGQVKVARYDADRGVDSLTLERITMDSADQRAGRAARLGPGLVRRLWDARDRLRAHREPEIARVDLAAPVLDLLAWGADPLSFEWFETPSTDRIHAALRLLHRLVRSMAKAPARASRRSAVNCSAFLSILALRGFCSMGAEPPRQRNGARRFRGCERCAGCAGALGALGAELQRIASNVLGGDVASHITDEALRHALFTGYADRLAKRRPGVRDRFLLASGHGAALAREAAGVDGEYIVALDVVAAEREGISESRIRSASRVEREWIQPTSTAIEHRFDAGSGRARAARVERYDAIVLSETPVPVDALSAAALLAEAWLAREHDAATTQLLRRLRFAAIDVDLRALVSQAAASARTAGEIDLAAASAIRSETFARRSRARVDRGAERPHNGARLRRGRHGVGVGEAAGAVRPRGIADRRHGACARHVSPARAQRPSRADDERPAQLLGTDVSRGAQGTAGPISKAPVAGRSVDSAADTSDDTEGASGDIVCSRTPGKSIYL